MKNKFFIFIFLFGIFFSTKCFAFSKSENYQDFGVWYEQQYATTSMPFKAVAVFDFETQKPLYYFQENKMMPSASLMKLVTAGAVMKYKVDWDKKVGFTINDNDKDLRKYVGKNDNIALLRLASNDKITMEQMFASMLIGSANNAANAMPRLLGLKKIDFIKSMKDLAKKWGMTNTKIDETSGLSLNDITTAHDIALAACNAFKNNFISKYSSSKEFDFTTDLGVDKKIKHTVHDLRNNPTNYFGAKTGFLYETNYHVAAGYITPNGKKICLAILNSKTRDESEGVISKIGEWLDDVYKN